VVPVYSVDGDERQDISRALGVQGFPTIVFVDERGRRFVYEGARTVDAITSFVCHNSSRQHKFCTRVA
jgi:thioredoxin-like negative regulator of GroEL